jgi:hypothetical protein
MINEVIYKKYLVLDNFLSNQEYNHIKETVLSDIFPLYHCKVVVDKKDTFFKDNKNYINSTQFFHTFYDNKKINSDFYYDIGSYVLNKINLNLELIRAKVNIKFLTMNTNQNSFDSPHIDYDGEHISAIYYINHTDGDTFLFKNNGDMLKRISPKANRLLIFKGGIIHAAGFPINYDHRCIINYVFKL